MAGSFSLSEKLMVAGAFVALVAMVIGTEDDPGVLVTGQPQIDAATGAPLATRGASPPAADWTQSKRRPGGGSSGTAPSVPRAVAGAPNFEAPPPPQNLS